MNEFEPEGGLVAKMQLLFDGPELKKEQENAQEVFPDKTEDDLYALISIRVKGDPEEAIAELKALLEGFGLTEEMWSEFAQIEFKAGDQEVFIGIAPSNEELLGFLTPFLINPTWIKGDGSEDLGITTTAALASSLSDMLDDQPAFKHLLKGFSVVTEGKVYKGSKDIFTRIVNENWDKIAPLASMVPILPALLMLNKIQGELKLKCTDEMTEEIEEMVNEMAPPLALSLKDAISLGKQSGLVPVEMVEPFLEFIKTHFAGELRIFG